MTMQQIVQEMLKEPDKYCVKRTEKIPVGIEPVRKSRKKRVQKKWNKRYGMKTKYEEKKVTALDVTVDMIMDFCQEHQIPITDILGEINNG